MKTFIKRWLASVGLYEPAHKVWVHHPDLRSLCENFGYRLVGAPDGLKIPPDNLIYQVIISREVARYLYTGNINFQSILFALQKQGLRVEEFKNILDFGCGCGRVLRYWKSIQGPCIFGTDYNRKLIEWCNKNLSSIAEFKVNQLNPPLDYEDEQFDFIYAISVFTHLPGQLQKDWMRELARLTKPGKYLLITLHGNSRILELEPEELQRFKAGQLVVKQFGSIGSNNLGAFHPYEYVIKHLTAGFELVDYIPQGARASNQDIYLLRKL